MTSRLGRIFERFSSSSSKALPAPVSARSLAEENFRSAVFSTSCRTKAFVNAMEGVEWFEAIADIKDRNHWSVRKVTISNNITGDAVPVGEPVMKFKTLQDDLPFFSAIRELATYECAQTLSGTLPAEEQQDSPLIHYKQAAEREAIIFDTSGMPHPTNNGEIVTDGSFTREDVARLRLISKENAGKYFDSADMITNFLIPDGKYPIDFADYATRSKDYYAVNMTQDCFADMNDLMVNLFCDGKFPKDLGYILTADVRTIRNKMNHLNRYCLDDCDMNSTENPDVAHYKSLVKLHELMQKHNADTPARCFEKMRAVLERVTPDLPFGKAKNKALEDLKDTACVYFSVMSDRAKMAHFEPESHSYVQHMDDMQARIPQIKADMIKLGVADSETWRLDNLLLGQFTQGPLTALTTMSEELTKVKDAIQASIERDRRGLTALQPPGQG